MKLPFNNYFPISQEFGNKIFINGNDYYFDSYKLQGHDGIDFSTPEGTPILAPISGTVKEANYDPNGYGWYVKIENETEGVVLAHLQPLTIQQGFIVKEGDQVGLSDTSGKVFGTHLHFGYYPIPRNRQNGYDGYIDQRPILEKAGLIEPITASTSVNNSTISTPLPSQTVSPENNLTGITPVTPGGGGDSGNSEGKMYTQAQYDAAMADRAKFWRERDESRADVIALKEMLKTANEQIKTLQETQTIVQTTTVGDTSKLEALQQENNTLVQQLADSQQKLTISLADYQAYKTQAEEKLNNMPVATDEDTTKLLDIIEDLKTKMSGLVEELKQATKRANTLAKMVAKKEDDDYTAITLGLDAMKELEAIKQAYKSNNPEAFMSHVSDLLSLLKNIPISILSLFKGIKTQPVKTKPDETISQLLNYLGYQPNK